MLRSKPQPEPSDGLDVGVSVDPLHEWRMRCLCDAGFSEFMAFRLSVVDGVDWHRAAGLLSRGCDEQTVYDILSD